MTFSEFGRRIKSNSSLGTDHGAGAPMFLFGKNVVAGVVGTSPTIPSNVTVNDNIPFQYDFRSVYASVLQKWFCVDDTTLQTILFRNFQTMNIVKSIGCSNSGGQTAGDSLVKIKPNPFVTSTIIEFSTTGGHTLIQIIDTLGRVVRTPVDSDYTAGIYQTTFISGELPSGVYYVRLQNGPIQQVKPMLKVRG